MFKVLTRSKAFSFLISFFRQEQITENLNYLFGIALSADDEPSLRIMACHALYACTFFVLKSHRLILQSELTFFFFIFDLQVAHGLTTSSLRTCCSISYVGQRGKMDGHGHTSNNEFFIHGRETQDELKRCTVLIFLYPCIFQNDRL